MNQNAKSIIDPSAFGRAKACTQSGLSFRFNRQSHYCEMAKSNVSHFCFLLLFFVGEALNKFVAKPIVLSTRGQFCRDHYDSFVIMEIDQLSTNSKHFTAKCIATYLREIIWLERSS